MYTLAFDTSSLAGGVALLQDGDLLAEIELPTEQRSAQSLAPAIDRILRNQQLAPRDIRLVALTIGPGSFTGLRVGATCAKLFCYAVQADLIALDTLDVIAAQTPLQLRTTGGEIHAVLDAQRRELFVARYAALPAQPNEPQRLGETSILSADEWLTGLPPRSVVTGSGLKKFHVQLPPSVVAVDAALWAPRAAMIGRMAVQQHARGQRDDIWKLTPTYIRPSYADEKRPAR